MELHSHLPRLPPPHYQGFAMIHWTMSVKRRASGWLTELFHARFREALLLTCLRYKMFCPVYILMPDHLHMMRVGFHRHPISLQA